MRIIFHPSPPAGAPLQPDWAPHAAAGRETGKGAAVTTGNTFGSHFHHLTIIFFNQAEQVLTNINPALEEDKLSSSLPSSPRLSRDHQDVLRMSGSNMHSQSKLLRYDRSNKFYLIDADTQRAVPESCQSGAEDLSAGDKDQPVGAAAGQNATVTRR